MMKHTFSYLIFWSIFYVILILIGVSITSFCVYFLREIRGIREALRILVWELQKRGGDK